MGERLADMRSGTGSTGQRPAAAVTDARLRMAVNIIRSLGRAGVPVTALETVGAPAVLGYLSRFAAARKSYRRHPDGRPVLGDLMAATGQGGVLIPVLTDMVTALAADPATVARSGIRTLVPPLESLRIAHDKGRCFELGRKLGVPVPATRLAAGDGVDPDDPAALRAWADDLPFPVIVKLRSGEDLGLAAADRYVVCRDRDAFEHHYRRLHALQADPLVQEYVTGEDYGAALLYDGASRPVATFTYRSLRQRPMAGGPTTLAETIDSPEMLDYARRMLDALGWRGMAMFDFRLDGRGRLLLLEINPRFWGSLALAPLAGVDFPLLYYRSALGEMVDPPRQRNGVRVRFFPHDFLSVVEYSRGERGPVRRAAYLARSALELLDPRLPDGLFSRDDLRPWVSYLANGVLKRKGHGL